MFLSPFLSINTSILLLFSTISRSSPGHLPVISIHLLNHEPQTENLDLVQKQHIVLAGQAILETCHVFLCSRDSLGTNLRQSLFMKPILAVLYINRSRPSSSAVQHSSYWFFISIASVTLSTNPVPDLYRQALLEGFTGVEDHLVVVAKDSGGAVAEL